MCCGLRAAGVRAELARPRHSRSVCADDSRRLPTLSRPPCAIVCVSPPTTPLPRRQRLARTRHTAHASYQRPRLLDASHRLRRYGQRPFFALGATFRLVLVAVRPRKSVGAHQHLPCALSRRSTHDVCAPAPAAAASLAVPTAEEGAALACQVVLWCVTLQPLASTRHAKVKEKQKNADAVKEKEEPFDRGVWVGFRFGKNGPGRQTGLGGGSGYDDGALATIF
ncbi:hypothetical protein K438DRAFT_1069198 [Mycena galopus ATCC 62051]|nr:hypothetical protein K438DRAFT_1069198 [Mycena galopus ATCC 62051]